MQLGRPVDVILAVPRHWAKRILGSFEFKLLTLDHWIACLHILPQFTASCNLLPPFLPQDSPSYLPNTTLPYQRDRTIASMVRSSRGPTSHAWHN